MTVPPPAPAGGPPPGPGPAWPAKPTAARRRGHAWSVVLTVLLVTVTAFFGLVFSVVWYDDGDSGLELLLSVVSAGYALGLGAVVAFRARYPVALTLLGGFGALVLPVGPVAALVGLTSVIATRDRRTAWWLGALTAVATAVSLVRDAVRSPDDAVFASVPEGGTVPVQASVWGYVALGGVGFVVAVSIGLVRRSQGDAARAARETQAQVQVTEGLRTQVARQDERELIAREVHDALAHRLSLVSLHSGALEVSVPADQPELQQAAQVVRENAHRSLEDLRDLVALLRDPDGLTAATPPGGSAVAVGLATIHELVDATRSSGVPLVATVVLEDPSAASPQLGRAAYRIVQEALTNARKHAPGLAVDLDVRASAATGVSIRVVNPLPPTAAVPPGSRTGRAGMLARATQLGGRAHAGPRTGPRGPEFIVEAWLPWIADGSPRPDLRRDVGGRPCDGGVTRVLLVDDDPLVRTGLRMILQSDPEIEVVAEASDGSEAVPAVQAHRPDVVLMDLRMARLDGIAATAAVRALPDPPAVVVLTSFDADENVLRALEAGASGFLLKDAAPREIVDGVRAVADGDAVLAPRVARFVVAHVATSRVGEETVAARHALAQLTDRERDIAGLVAEGLSNADIAQRVYVSEATVKTHLGRVMTKLGLANRVQVALLVERAR
ncbi:response regulator [Luteimicrobium album]|uniref:response regulator n=1 Tax=Luteimicrobium album TaxID=1054550 RepID=UPI0032AF53A6